MPCPATYETQFRFSTGEVVDAVVRLRDKLLPIDSKFHSKITAAWPTSRGGPPRILQRRAVSRRVHLQEVHPAWRRHAGYRSHVLCPRRASIRTPALRRFHRHAAGMNFCRSKGIVPSRLHSFRPSSKSSSWACAACSSRKRRQDSRQFSPRSKSKSRPSARSTKGWARTWRNAQQSYTDADRKLDRTATRLDSALDQLNSGRPAGKGTGRRPPIKRSEASGP